MLQGAYVSTYLRNSGLASVRWLLTISGSVLAGPSKATQLSTLTPLTSTAAQRYSSVSGAPYLSNQDAGRTWGGSSAVQRAKQSSQYKGFTRRQADACVGLFEDHKERVRAYDIVARRLAASGHVVPSCNDRVALIVPVEGMSGSQEHVKAGEHEPIVRELPVEADSEVARELLDHDNVAQPARRQARVSEETLKVCRFPDFQPEYSASVYVHHSPIRSASSTLQTRGVEEHR